MPKILIGFTGSFGSGCSFIAENHLTSKGYGYISLSKILKGLYKQEFGRDPEKRSDLQDYGNELRGNDPSRLSKEAIKLIEESPSISQWVIDSIKNPFEVKFFRDKYPGFYLIGVFAEYSIRWERKKTVYNGNQGNFDADDKRDSDEDFLHGQRVRDCFAISDLILLNDNNYNKGSNDYLGMEGKIADFLKLINKPFSRPPSEEEALMAIAYANSLRSSCLKRKVGAVIVDNRGSILSSGCNEVAFGEDPCKGAHGGCYRDYKKNEISNDIDKVIPDPETNDIVKKMVLKKYKMLELCRSLHAEETAIINIARFGSQVNLFDSTLYTTTYPCNLCAQKIAQVGIGKIVYMEPYPQEEAKKLLINRGIKQKPFEGVAYRGYFKLLGSENLG